MRQTLWIDRGKGVPHVDQPEQESPVLVRSEECSSGSQNTRHFGQQQILPRIGGDVVQHCEADGSVETPVREWQVNGISLNHINVCSGCPARNGLRQDAVQLHACQAVNARTEHLGGNSVAGTDFQNVPSWIDAFERPR